MSLTFIKRGKLIFDQKNGNENKSDSSGNNTIISTPPDTQRSKNDSLLNSDLNTKRKKTIKLNSNSASKQFEETKNKLSLKLHRMTQFLKNTDNKHIEQDDFDFVLNDEKYLNLIWEIFNKKEKRSLVDNQIIQGFLQTMTGFVEMLKRAFNNDQGMVTELLTTVSFYLTYEKFEAHSLLFKCGDKGEKFYIILKGSVDVIIPKEKKVRITEFDYINYLATLKKYGEIDLLNRTLQLNRYNYGIEIEENEEGKNKEKESENNKEMNKDNINMENEMTPLIAGDASPLISAVVSKRNSITSRPSLMRRVSLNAVEELSRRMSFLFRQQQCNDGGANNFVNNNPNNYPQTKQSSTSHSKKKLLQLHVNPAVTVTSEEYINRIKVYKEYQDQDQAISPNFGGNVKIKLINVTIFEYHLVASLTTGQKFGDIALENSNQKRVATIITKEDSHFGVLNKESYTRCIREVNEKSKKLNLNFILSNQLFSGINKSTFDKKYYNDFAHIKFTRGHKLVFENEDIPAIFLIKDGEYDVTIHKSLDEITEMLKENDKKLITNQPLFGRAEKHRCIYDKDFKRFYEQKKNIRISIIKGKDLIGLEDYFMKGKSAITVECTSSKGEVFFLDFKFFEQICNNLAQVMENRENLIKAKKDIFLNKLKNLREIKLSSYKNMTERDHHLFIGGEYNLNYKDSKSSEKKMTNNQIFSEFRTKLSKQKIEGALNRMKKEKEENQRESSLNNTNNKMKNFDFTPRISAKNIESMISSNLNSLNNTNNNLEEMSGRDHNSILEEKETEKIKEKIENKEGNEEENETKNHKPKKLTENTIKNYSYKTLISPSISPLVNKTLHSHKKIYSLKVSPIKLNHRHKNSLVLPTTIPSIPINSNNNNLDVNFNNSYISTMTKGNNLFVNLKKSIMTTIIPKSNKADIRKNLLKLDKENEKEKKNGPANNNHTITQNINTKSRTTRNSMDKMDKLALATDSKYENIYSNNKFYNNTNNFMTTHLNNITSENSFRVYNTIKEKDNNLQFSLNDYYLQPSEHGETQTAFNSTVNSPRNNKMHFNTTQARTTASSLMNERAKLLYSAEKMQSLKQIRYNDESDFIFLDTFQLEQRRKEKFLAKRDNLKLRKTGHNLFRFIHEKKKNVKLKNK